MNAFWRSGHYGAVTAIPMIPLTVAGEDDLDAVVTQLRAGDRDAVEQVYVAHHQVIRGFARRLVGDEAAAEDIVHETFVALPKVIKRYRGDGSLRSFLIGVAVNHSRRYIRSTARRRRATERMAARDASEPTAVDGVEQAIAKRLAHRLWIALDQLPHDQRVVFVLCEAEQRTSVEVAHIVGAPEGTVRTRLFHAKRKLRELLGDREGQ